MPYHSFPAKTEKHLKLSIILIAIDRSCVWHLYTVQQFTEKLCTKPKTWKVGYITTINTYPQKPSWLPPLPYNFSSPCPNTMAT